MVLTPYIIRTVVTSAPALSMLDALMAAGYSLRDAAAALHLSATDLLDAAESAAQPLAALDAFTRQVAELQLMDSRLEALRALVEVCRTSDNLEKKRLAAQAILRFDPFRAPRATGNGGRSNPPRSPRDTRESSDDTATPSPVPNTPRPFNNGEPSRAASFAHAEAPAPRQDWVPRLDRPLLSSTPSPGSTAGKPCEPSSVPAPSPPPAEPQASGAPRSLLTHSPAHLFTCSPAQLSAAALTAAAGHAISVFAFLAQTARAPPLRAAA